MEIDKETWLNNYDLFSRLLKERKLSEADFPFHELDSDTIGLLERHGENGSTVYSLSPAVQLLHHGFLSRWSDLMEEPPADKTNGRSQKVTMDDDLDRSAEGVSAFIRALQKKFPWIIDVRNHSRGLDFRRCHLLPRTPDPAVHGICFSDGDKAVGLSVITTARTERHVTFVRLKLAESLAESTRTSDYGHQRFQTQFLDNRGSQQ